MNDIKPIEIEITTKHTKGWACDRCDATFVQEIEARNHRATHCFTKSTTLGFEPIYYFENEKDFKYWRRWGTYYRDGGCSGPWIEPGWYLIDWKGPNDCEYPSLELASSAIALRLANAKYDYEKASNIAELFAKLAS